MVSTPICRACRQALRQQVRQLRQVQTPYQSRAGYLRAPKFARTLSTSPPLFAVEAKPAPPTFKSPAVSKESPQPAQEVEIAADSPTRAIAKELRKRASSVTETYVAYGVCEKLVKECARQANYTIPQAHEKNVDIPKTKDGEDLGVGTGWWYETLGLTPTFNTWAQITFLHMYLPHRAPALLPPRPCTNVAPTPSGPLLLHRRRPHGDNTQHSRPLYPKQIPKRSLRAMARADGWLR
ncbi:hypothetical protein ABVK25_007972 [Lepraria finkii]|uniref:Uncharacterized protein n=1 Tax=Lepraria finkii TaxID=1340010 RepID=A0ABR4B475_9LECA